MHAWPLQLRDHPFNCWFWKAGARRYTDKHLNGLVNRMPTLPLVSFCLCLNKNIPRADKFKDYFENRGTEGGELRHPTFIPGDRSVNHSLPCRASVFPPVESIFKSFSLSLSPFTGEQADEASVLAVSCSTEAHGQIALRVPNPADRRSLETNKTAYTGKAIALYIGLRFFPCGFF